VVVSLVHVGYCSLQNGTVPTMRWQDLLGRSRFGVFRFFTSFVFVCGVFYWWKANAEDGLNTNAFFFFSIWLIWIDFGLVWIGFGLVFLDLDLNWIDFGLIWIDV